jgi:hypothetical protein
MPYRSIPQPIADSQCLGKTPFADVIRAREVAHKQSQRRDIAAVAYKCAVCHFWHVGSNNRMEKKFRGASK